MRILMLGNSFTFFNDMPDMLAELTGAEVVAHTRGGARLSEQLNPNTRMGAATQAALREEKWDYVVLQEMSNGPITSPASFFSSVTRLIEEHLPDELAIEAPFFGKNVQSMLKLGRAQGVAITAALLRDIPISEYAPLKIKMAITGNGSASKEQVADMLRRILHIPQDLIPQHLDATDGLAAAYCHFLQGRSPVAEVKYHGWKDFLSKNPDKISERKR